MTENWESKSWLLLFHPVLIHLSYCNKNTINSVAWVTSICFLKFWRLKSLRSWCQQIWCLVYKYLSFGYIFTGQKGEGSPLGSFFNKGTNPFHWELYLNDQITPPKVLPPNTITLRFGFQHMNWRHEKEERHIQIIAYSMFMDWKNYYGKSVYTT